MKNKIITIARKPLSINTYNTIKNYQTAGINIDKTRIEGPPWTWGFQTDIKGGGYGSNRPSEGNVFARNIEGNSKGRWPANLILQHKKNCQRIGTKEIKKNGVGSGVLWSHYRDDKVENAVKPEKEDTSEAITLWECEEGCPVKKLNYESKNDTEVSRFFKQVQKK